MNHRHKLRWTSIAIAAALVAGAVPVWADSPEGTAAVAEAGTPASLPVIGSTPIGSATIGSASRMELKDVILLPNDDGKTVAFTLTLHNDESTDLEFINYWVRLQSKAGNQFTVNLLPQDQDKNRIPPRTSQDFHFYAKLNATTELSDLIFNLIRWDFNVTDFERVVGQVTVPEDYSYVTPTGSRRQFSLANVPFIGHIKRTTVSQNDDYYLPALYFELENAGTSSVKLPELQFFIRTKSGLVYPLESPVLVKDFAIQPLVRKEGLLSGSIPREVEEEGWQLVIAQTISGSGENAGTVQMPLAFFEIPATDAEDVSIGNDYRFSNKDGTYTARLNALQRLPWEDQDILTAAITLRNDGSSALPIPELTGYFKLDDNVKIDAKLVRTDKVIGIGAGKEINVQVAAKIPYTYEFASLKLYLQEKEGTDKTVDLLQFNHNKELMSLATVGLGEKKTYTDIGRRAVYGVLSSQTFKGDYSDLYTVQIEAENLEKRFSDVRKQVAQFKGLDGTVFPAQMMEIKNKVNPGGKALIYAYATMPKSYDTSGMMLILGDAVQIDTSGGGTGGTGGNDGGAAPASDGYVNAASFGVPLENTEPKADFQELALQPYTLSLGRIGTSIQFEQDKVDFEFDYELSKNSLIETDMTDRKLVLEIEDDLEESKTHLSLTKAFSFERGTSGDSSAGTGSGDILELGSHRLKVSFTSEDEHLYNVRDFKTYKLNVYHQFKDGQKKLIASRELDWFRYND